MKAVIIKVNFYADSRTYLAGQIIEEPTEKLLSLVESKEEVNGVVAVEKYVAQKEDKKESGKKDSGEGKKESSESSSSKSKSKKSSKAKK